MKQAAAQANAEVRSLDPAVSRAIADACVDIREGMLHDQFVVDLIRVARARRPT
ncbi:hypothetical protein [Streptomyces sp. NPDC021139]|uniref:hypothetical protein n=1 Tax=Streptomyces sp. NPDC021139 TaxID=3154899 RepID=UPI0033CF3519